jgi:transcriptional regulator with XRE-family HTH domain
MKYQRIRDLREDADLSQKELAEKLGLYTTTYARYEQGKQEIPFYLAIELAKFYDVSLDYIAGIVPVKEKLSR